MHADATEVRNRIEPIRERREERVAEQQGVTTAQDHFPQARVESDAPERRFPRGETLRSVVVGIVAAEAVPAVDRTLPRGDEQRASFVLAEESRTHFGGVVADRVETVGGCGLEFVSEREDLAKQRVVGIPRVDPFEVRTRDHERELGRGAESGLEE